jgi:uncharacterized protein (DUF885 family)
MRDVDAVALLLAGAAVAGTLDAYVERWLRTFPCKATEAGRHDLDGALEDLAPERRADWLAFNRTTRDTLRRALADRGLGPEDRLDAEVVLAQTEREIHELEVLERPQRDPLYWTAILGNAAVFLLARDDLPLHERAARARARARLVPRLVDQARAALAAADLLYVAPELCVIAARQARGTASFYRDGLPRAAVPGAGPTRQALTADGRAAAEALEAFAAFLDELGQRAAGSPRHGSDYAATLRAGLGVEERPDALLARAEAALAVKRKEAAVYGRSVFGQLLPAETPPTDDRALLRRLFERVAADRDGNLLEYEAGWRRNVREIEAFLREKDLATLPDPLSLIVDRSPSYFVGQSVGGVYPAGPFAPDAKTILFLPVPPDGATPEARDAFFRDFNRHFNRMIVPHELLPGHYFQLKWAARHPRKARALFPDPVYVEGWGTFCERLLLDLGWGGPLDRLAHLKKQLENVARAVVDVRVHARGMTRTEVIAFVRDEALQDEQFAANMWTRAITTSPQLLTYWLGYEEVMGLHEDVRQARGQAFRTKAFVDEMMALGPVPVRRYRERMLKGER